MGIDTRAVASSKAETSATPPKGIGRHAPGGMKALFSALGKRPSSAERKARTAERHRLRFPTRLAVIVAVVGLGFLLSWAVGPSFAGR